MKNIVIALFAILILFACAKQESQPPTAEKAPAEQEGVDPIKMAMMKADPAGNYGEALTLNEAIAIGDLLAAADQHEGKRVRVSGTVTDVCPMKGCWIQVASGDEKIKVKVNDGEIVFPLSAKEQEVVVEGLVERLEMTESQHISYKAHLAEEKGEPFDSSSVSGPLVTWRIKGLGAEIAEEGAE